MTVDIYKNSSPLNYVNKSIALVDNLECDLKEDCDITNPVIEVYGTNALNGNYMFIPLFSRYYYITKMITENIDTILITGHVDVLMSFQSSLLKAQGIINRQENIYNGYLKDMQAPLISYPRIQTKKFPVGFYPNPTYILITSGGI